MLVGDHRLANSVRVFLNFETNPVQIGFTTNGMTLVTLALEA